MTVAEINWIIDGKTSDQPDYNELAEMLAKAKKDEQQNITNA
jgi:hypothetical protein